MTAMPPQLPSKAENCPVADLLLPAAPPPYECCNGNRYCPGYASYGLVHHRKPNWAAALAASTLTWEQKAGRMLNLCWDCRCASGIPQAVYSFTGSFERAESVEDGADWFYET